MHMVAWVYGKERLWGFSKLIYDTIQMRPDNRIRKDIGIIRKVMHGDWTCEYSPHERDWRALEILKMRKFHHCLQPASLGGKKYIRMIHINSRDVDLPHSRIYRLLRPEDWWKPNNRDTSAADTVLPPLNILLTAALTILSRSSLLCVIASGTRTV